MHTQWKILLLINGLYLTDCVRATNIDTEKNGAAPSYQRLWPSDDDLKKIGVHLDSLKKTPLGLSVKTLVDGDECLLVGIANPDGTTRWDLQSYLEHWTRHR